MPLEERWNTHFSTTVEQELFGVQLTLRQDPSSENLGTTVWDASIVLAKYLEKHARRGDWSASKLAGKRCIELGAGMGLAGAAAALMGAQVTFTDLPSVVPLLRLNVHANLSPAALQLAGAEFGQARGAAPPSVCELDWADAGARDALKPAFDFLLAADCVYSEAAVPAFLDCLAALSSPRSRILVANEFRCARVHEAFELGCKPTFVLRRVPATRLHPDYRHPAIHVYALTRRGASAGL